MRYYTVDRRDLTKAYLCPFSDTHIGRRDIDIDAITDYVAWVRKTPCVLVWLNGDLLECIPRDAPGDIYDLELVKTSDQVDRVVEIFYPIRNRIIAVTDGNHEGRIYRKTGFDISREIARRLGVIRRYDATSCMIRLRIGKEYYYIYGTHGWMLARTIGARANAFEYMFNNVEADVYIVSHSHAKLLYSRERAYPLTRPMKIQMRKKFGVMSSSWSRWYKNSFVESRQFIPPSRGTARIRLDGARWDVHASI